MHYKIPNLQYVHTICLSLGMGSNLFCIRGTSVMKLLLFDRNSSLADNRTIKNGGMLLFY